MSLRPTKILHVVYFLEPGGMENGIVNITKGLDPREFESHFCCVDRKGAFSERLPHPENIHVLGRQSGFSLRALLKLACLVKHLKVNLVHSHNLGPLIYSALGSGFGLSCPVIQGEHSLLTREECTKQRLRQRKLFYRGCREIHTVSAQLRDQLVKLSFPSDQISVIRNGVDSAWFVPGPAQSARRQIGLGHLPACAKIFGVVGRFGAFKRHAVLIEAFERLGGKHENIHLLVVGDGGPEKGRVYQQVAKSPFAERIHLAGFQNNTLPYYQAMDVLVIPSENEGMSNALLEAMSCGVPALAHDICGNSEVISSEVDGFIADLSSAEALAHELEKILAVQPKLDKMKQMAREKVLNLFSITKMVDQYAELYRRNARNR
jgi:glycosyltransferase involved in cell wall biosynthesis